MLGLRLCSLYPLITLDSMEQILSTVFKNEVIPREVNSLFKETQLLNHRGET